MTPDSPYTDELVEIVERLDAVETVLRCTRCRERETSPRRTLALQYARPALCHRCSEYLRRHQLLPMPASELQILVRGTRCSDPAVCWPWRGRLDAEGYGQIGNRGVHRVMYERMRGPIPPGLVIDHLCRNRACANPWHLEPVSIGENARRGEAPMVMVWKTNTCPRGHSMADAAVVQSGPQAGRRNCRTCIQERYDRKAADPEWRARRAAQEKANRLRRLGRAS